MKYTNSINTIWKCKKQAKYISFINILLIWFEFYFLFCWYQWNRFECKNIVQTVEKRIKSHGFVIVLHDIKGLLCVLMKYAASISCNHVHITLLIRLKRLFFLNRLIVIVDELLQMKDFDFFYFYNLRRSNYRNWLIEKQIFIIH